MALTKPLSSTRYLTVVSVSKAADAVITTSAAHGLSVGQALYFAGMAPAGFSGLDGAGTVKAVTSATVFTVETDTSGYTGTYTASSATVQTGAKITASNETAIELVPAGYGDDVYDKLEVFNGGAAGLVSIDGGVQWLYVPGAVTTIGSDALTDDIFGCLSLQGVRICATAVLAKRLPGGTALSALYGFVS